MFGRTSADCPSASESLIKKKKKLELCAACGSAAFKFYPANPVHVPSKTLQKACVLWSDDYWKNLHWVAFKFWTCLKSMQVNATSSSRMTQVGGQIKRKLKLKLQTCDYFHVLAAVTEWPRLTSELYKFCITISFFNLHFSWLESMISMDSCISR